MNDDDGAPYDVLRQGTGEVNAAAPIFSPSVSTRVSPT